MIVDKYHQEELSQEELLSACSHFCTLSHASKFPGDYIFPTPSHKAEINLKPVALISQKPIVFCWLLLDPLLGQTPHLFSSVVAGVCSLTCQLLSESWKDSEGKDCVWEATEEQACSGPREPCSCQTWPFPVSNLPV